MKKILVTNDDGIAARGLECLVEELSKIADVYVVAPASQQSGKSHSITFLRDVTPEEREMKGACEAWTLDGTPADCVMWGVGKLKEEGVAPDCVISGINMGYNAGLTAYYSGTVAGAREGAIHGIRSIALSAGSHEATHFDYLLGLIPRLLELSRKLDPHTILNVNAPDIPSWEIKGVAAVEAAPCGYGLDFFFEHSDDGRYRMTGGPAPSDDMMRYDIDWNSDGYVTVSPLPTSLSDPVSLLKLKGLTRPEDCLTVIVDAQEKMLSRIKKAGRFERNLGKLVHAVSRMGRPLLFTESHDMGETVPELRAFADGSETVRHIHPDSWTSPDMETYVGSLDPQRVLVAGACSNVELLQTALGFAERGFDVVVIEDCCAASKKKAHKMAMRYLQDAGCRISTCETEIMELAGSCSKQVLDSVKNILFS